MADCVGVELLRNVCFRNFAKFSRTFYFVFCEICLQFREIKNVFVKISRNTKF